MSKTTLTNLVNLQNETAAVTAINNNNATIVTAFDNTLSRDGSSPNQMGSNIDMNSHQVINLTDGVLNTDAVNVRQLNGITIGKGNVPAGGSTNQVLTKNSSTNYDMTWQNAGTANLTGPISATGNVTSITSQTGTGTKFVVDTGPTLIAPALGAAVAASINKVALTTPATGSTLTIVDGKTLTVNNSLTLSGTDGTTQTFPGTSGAVITDQTVNGVTNHMLAQAPAFSIRGNKNNATADVADFTIPNLNQKVSPVSADKILLVDSASSPVNEMKYCLVSAVASAGSVSSIAGNTGAFSLTNGVTNSTNAIQVDPTYFNSWIGGLTLSNDGGSPNTVLDIAAGSCTDSTNSILIKLGTFTKSTAGSWVAGTSNNGMGVGLTIANSTWYHVFATITGGFADVYFDTSVTAANKPASTTAFRRLGSFRTNGSAQIIAFTQIGDDFWWTVPVRDANTQNIGTTATDIALTTPANIITTAYLTGSVFATGAGSIAWFYPKFQTDQTVAYGSFSSIRDGSAGNGASTSIPVVTNASATPSIRARCSTAGGTIDIVTNGWKDLRGKS